MNENEFYVVKEYIFVNPHKSQVDSMIDSCYGDCHNKYFHKFICECIYDIQQSLLISMIMI